MPWGLIAEVCIALVVLIVVLASCRVAGAYDRKTEKIVAKLKKRGKRAA
jgi:hypothetical protein